MVVSTIAGAVAIAAYVWRYEILVILGTTFLLLASVCCATTKTFCSLEFQGIKYRGIVRTTVIGKGTTDIEATKNVCGEFTAKTHDTGISEQMANAIKEIADVVSKNLRPGGQLEGGLAERLPERLRADEE